MNWSLRDGVGKIVIMDAFCAENAYLRPTVLREAGHIREVSLTTGGLIKQGPWKYKDIKKRKNIYKFKVLEIWMFQVIYYICDPVCDWLRM